MMKPRKVMAQSAAASRSVAELWSGFRQIEFGFADGGFYLLEGGMPFRVGDVASTPGTGQQESVLAGIEQVLMAVDGANDEFGIGPRNFRSGIIVFTCVLL